MPPISADDLRIRKTSHPILYEINARVLLNELSVREGKPLTLDKIPDPLLDEWSGLGIDAVWMMGVWTTGPLGVSIARDHPALREEYRKALPDFTTDDIVGSPYSVCAYTVGPSLGGKKALQTLRAKLAKRGIGLVLDFVCNHTARDHKWVFSNPEYFINGTDGEEKNDLGNYFRADTKKGPRTIAFGRDPYFPGWTDTAQLNSRHPQARKEMIGSLLEIAGQCDGVRCDMAMLLLNEVFNKTWGGKSKPEGVPPVESEFWADAISAVRAEHPNFLFVAEAYWNLEWPLQQLGFNYTYDKTLYDRLSHEGATAVSDHLKAEMIYQKRSARFIENHDEPRIAQLLPSEAWQYAAAAVAATVPGMVLLHEGQLDGRKVKIPVQLGRRPVEEPNATTRAFYGRLLSFLKSDTIQNGEWRLLSVRPAWHENYSYQNIISYCWSKGSSQRVVVINYAPLNSQCYIDIALENMKGTAFEFRDLMGPAVYVRDRTGLLHKGMYFDLPGYGMHFFEVTTARK